MSQVAYVLMKPFGSNNEGDVIHMESEEAQALVDAGILSEAKEEDLHKEEEATEEEEVAPEQNEALSKAIARISKNLESSIASATAKAVSSNKSRNAPALSVPAEPKKEVYKCMGEMLKDT